MTAPRQVLPGATCFVTRRCSQREYLLRPSKDTNDIFLYVLAVAAQRFGILVHAVCVMSNHTHLVVTDPKAQLPRFEQFLNSQVARATNAMLGRWDSLWESDTYNAARLVAADDVVLKIGYVLANPVAAGLVRHARDWPGVWLSPLESGHLVVEVDRPTHFFAAGGDMPDKVSLELSVPPGFESGDDYRDRVAKALRRCEMEARERVQDRFIGRARVLAQSPRTRPSSVEPRRELNPHIAAKDASMRIEALTARKKFVRDHRDAMAARRAGDLQAIFPVGTYYMRVAHGVPCAASG